VADDPHAWRALARCNGEPTQLFFPDPGDRQQDYTLAKSICYDCPVKQQCLDYALSGEHGAHGCWGGTSPRDRKLIRRRRKMGEIHTLNYVLQVSLDI
jgi:WhiB family redox-sensing transcriptional regulator